MKIIQNKKALEELKTEEIYLDPIYGVMLVLDIFKEEDELIIDPKYYGLAKNNKTSNQIFSGTIIKLAKDSEELFSIGDRVIFEKGTGNHCNYLGKFNLITLDQENLLAKLDKDLAYEI